MLFRDEYDNIRDEFIAHAMKEHKVKFFPTRFYAVMVDMADDTANAPLQISSDNGVQVVFRKNDVAPTRIKTFVGRDKLLVDHFVAWITSGKAATETGYKFTLDEGAAGEAAKGSQPAPAPQPAPPPPQAEHGEYLRIMEESRRKFDADMEAERARNAAEREAERVRNAAEREADRVSNDRMRREMLEAMAATTQKLNRLRLANPTHPISGNKREMSEEDDDVEEPERVIDSDDVEDPGEQAVSTKRLKSKDDAEQRAISAQEAAERLKSNTINRITETVKKLPIIGSIVNIMVETARGVMKKDKLIAKKPGKLGGLGHKRA